ncbi:hypothetical protein HID58_095284 [Brassica napus]|uniref:Uncharacterized protein n=1 Tax=Brassica napus TaxID=3708 RepID=A0ABQ7X6G7_BRANA|nr:hypothetical protein HID58_095284 [Brassica napus]
MCNLSISSPKCFIIDLSNNNSTCSIEEDSRRSRVITLPPIGLGSTPISPWVLWTLWTNRNKLLFENKEYTVEESVLKILKDSKAWREAQESKKCIPLPQNVDLSRHVSNPHVPQLLLVAGSSWSVYSDAAWDS